MSDKKIYQYLYEWLEEVSPLPNSNQDTHSSTQWMISTGDIIGQYQETDLKIAEKLATRSGDGPSDEDVADLLKSPANILGIYSGLSMRSAGYDPEQMDLIENEERYRKYRNLLLKNPLINLVEAGHRYIKYEENNYNSLVNNSVSLFDNINELDAKKIKKSVARLLTLLTSSESAEIKTAKFSQDVFISTDIKTAYLNTNMSTIEFAKKGLTYCEVKPEYKSNIKVDYVLLKLNIGFVNKTIAKSLLSKFQYTLVDTLCKINPVYCKA